MNLSMVIDYIYNRYLEKNITSVEIIITPEPQNYNTKKLVCLNQDTSTYLAIGYDSDEG